MNSAISIKSFSGRSYPTFSHRHGATRFNKTLVDDFSPRIPRAGSLLDSACGSTLDFVKVARR